MKDKLLKDRELYTKAKEQIEKDWKFTLKTELPPVYYMYEGAIEYIDNLLEENNKIEKLNYTETIYNAESKVFIDKINEIIDRVNKK